MIRPIAIEVTLFLTPFVLYAVFLVATRAGLFDPESWPVSRMLTLAIVAMLLVVGGFIYFAQFGGAPMGSTYVPAHTKDGKFVPGQFR